MAGPPTVLVPRLAFAVEGARPLERAAVPTLAFALRVENETGQPVRSVVLDVQLQIAARRRGYEDADHDKLFDLFGFREDWGTNLRTLLWARTTLVIPPFEGGTLAELQVPCTYDLDVAATRYLDALGDGEVPLELLFSGTVFFSAPDGRLQTARIPWEAEAEYGLPVAVWREAMERHFPGTAWLRLPKEAHDRLCAYKARHALASWDDVVGRLLGEG